MTFNKQLSSNVTCSGYDTAENRTTITHSNIYTQITSETHVGCQYLDIMMKIMDLHWKNVAHACICNFVYESILALSVGPEYADDAHKLWSWTWQAIEV